MGNLLTSEAENSGSFRGAQTKKINNTTRSETRLEETNTRFQMERGDKYQRVEPTRASEFSKFVGLPFELQDMILESVECPRAIVISGAYFDLATRKAYIAHGPEEYDVDEDVLRKYAHRIIRRYAPVTPLNFDDFRTYLAPMRSNFTLPAITHVPGGTAGNIMRHYPYRFSGQLYTTATGVRFRSSQDTLIFETTDAWHEFNKAAPMITAEDAKLIRLSMPVPHTLQNHRHLSMIRAHAGVRFLGIGFGDWDRFQHRLYPQHYQLGIELATYPDLEILYLPEPMPMCDCETHLPRDGVYQAMYAAHIVFQGVTRKGIPYSDKDIYRYVAARTLPAFRKYVKRQYRRMMKRFFRKSVKDCVPVSATSYRGDKNRPLSSRGR